MVTQKHILTIEDFAEEKLKEKGSLFIAQCFPITDASKADKILDEIRKTYYDATHHCFAYKLLNDIKKYSDDGEPTGTAGIRILNALEHFCLDNVLIVVIRYFGGTKLGVGPLGKAYYNSAIGALEKAKIIKKKFYNKIAITVGFSHISSVHHVISNFAVKLKDTVYKDSVTFKVLVKKDEMEKFKERMIDELKGQVEIVTDDKIILE